MENIAF